MIIEVSSNIKITLAQRCVLSSSILSQVHLLKLYKSRIRLGVLLGAAIPDEKADNLLY
jgi:hypothetical protein